MAWAALIAAVVGTVFACIKGALVVGWILLPVAFILSIVGLIIKGRKWPAIAGLILSVVGTIIGIVVFTSLLADAVDEVLGHNEPQQGQVGSRDNPVALGSTISGDDFDVVVNSVDLDATDVVLANQFNIPPGDGNAYAVINATVTYKGEGSGYVASVGVDYVTGDGRVITELSTFAVPPDPGLSNLEELYEGASATGNLVLEVPLGDEGGLLRVRPGLLGNYVFVAIP